jgi:hypothetical protein
MPLRESGFDVAHRVVAEGADQAAAEARQAGQVGHLEARHELGNEAHRVAVVASLGDAVAAEHHDRALDHRDARAGSQADEGIAAEALAALHRFEQVGVGVVGQLEVDRQRRVEVGEGFERHRDAVIALRRKAVEV